MPIEGHWFKDQTIWCIDEGYPAPLTEALLELCQRTSEVRLAVAWEAWKAWYDDTEDMSDGDYEFDSFSDAVRHLTNGYNLPNECECGVVSLTDNCNYVSGGNLVCHNCIRTNYIYCGCCESYVRGRRLIRLNYGQYCQDCYNTRTYECDECGGRYDLNDGHNHDPIVYGCDCEAPHLEFNFPNDGNGVIREDTRLTLELPKGTIDENGIQRIKTYLQELRPKDWMHPDERLLDFYVVANVVDSIGPVWQDKDGTFTKRLSKAFYKRSCVKLPPAVISHIGNTAQEHSNKEATWHIEITRDVNQAPQLFCHTDSCWWSSYHRSRCALKQWGGMGFRTYYDEDADIAHGRFWVQPLNEDLKPTHDAVNAFAYVVYNVYGEVNGYAAARIVAHLAGKSYRKIQWSVQPQYINGSIGYLIADQPTCNSNLSIALDCNEHEKWDARIINPLATIARSEQPEPALT